jgi:hypothetical protein
MSPNGKTVYELRHLPIAGQQVRDIAKKAATKGKKENFLSAMASVLELLRTEPTTWGDPEYNLQQPGACVYHGVREPVIVKYAVFELDKIVLVMRVNVLARFWDEPI